MGNAYTSLLLKQIYYRISAITFYYGITIIDESENGKRFLMSTDKFI